MTHAYIPPPTDEDLIEYFVEWLAARACAKVTITIEVSETNKRSIIFDKRLAMEKERCRKTKK